MNPGSPTSAWTGRLGHIGRALRYRNYRLFFMGHGVSLIGTWMQRVAQAWLVYRMTGSEWLLGVVGFSGQILTFPLAPLAGVLADRVNRRWLIVATQAVATAQAALLAVLTLTGCVAVWHVIALSVFLGVVNAFDIPARQSFVVEMLESREDLPNAIAMNSFLVNGSRLIGPSLAGLAIARLDALWGPRLGVYVGEGVCFVLNAVSYFAIIAALLAMRPRAAARPPTEAHILHDLRDGLVYAFNFVPVRAILMMLATISLLGMSYSVLMPVFAKKVLGRGPEAHGFLLAAVSMGALVGTVYLASRRSVHGLGRVLAVASAAFGLALVAFSFSRSYYLSLGLLTIVGFGAMAQMASANSLLQTLVDDDKRGRIMSLYTMCFMGMGPFGSLLVGGLASRLGAPRALMIAGAGCALAAAVFGSQLRKLDKAVHPVYVRLGLAADPDAPGNVHSPPFPSSEEVRL